MVSFSIIEKIEKFVSEKPRSMQEIAVHLGKNWRTAERYVEVIIKERGTLLSRTFREGTRGALRIVYIRQPSSYSYSVFQEEFDKKIMIGNFPEEFSSFDIYQHIKEDKRTSEIFYSENEENLNIHSLIELLKKASKNLFIFSGNLSFINFSDSKNSVLEVLDELVQKDISIKVVGRIDIYSRKNLDKLLSLNHKYGKQMIEVKHRVQPLRCIIVDDKLFRLKEIKMPLRKDYELKNKIFMFYTIYDKQWVEWITNIFWKMFSSSIGAQKRIDALNSLPQPTQAF